MYCRQAVESRWVQVGAGHQEGRGNTLAWWRQRVPGFRHYVTAAYRAYLAHTVAMVVLLQSAESGVLIRQ